MGVGDERKDYCIMEEHIYISIIVPAYNAEKVIRDCMESILSQTLGQIEIIAVDDGSTDSTREMLRSYRQQDSRIRLIEKDRNEGLGAARNSGIRAARGEYIGFVDADDWVEKDYFASMYSEGKNADLIIAGYQHDAMEDSREKVYISRTVSMPEGCWDEKKQIICAAADVDTAKMFAYTWNKLYKRELIIQNELWFSKQVFIEDFIFNTLYWDKISSLCVVGHTGYHYIKASKEALTQKFQPEFLGIMDKRFTYIKRLLVKNNVYCGTGKEKLANVYIKHAVSGIVRNCSPEGDYSFFEQYRRARSLLREKHSRECRKYAKGSSGQEKLCNLVFKCNMPIALLCFSKVIYLMQTKTKTVFDRLK